MRFILHSVLTMVLLATCCAIVIAQDAHSPHGDNLSDWSRVLRDKHIRDKLKLRNLQLDRIEELWQRRQMVLQKLGFVLAELDQESRAALLKDTHAELQRLDMELADVLTDEQKRLLTQFLVRKRLSDSASNAGLLNTALEKQLELTEDQKTAIRRQAVEFHEQFTQKSQQCVEELRTLQKSQRDQLLQLLTPDQRQAYDELVGSELVIQPSISLDN